MRSAIEYLRDFRANIDNYFVENTRFVTEAQCNAVSEIIEALRKDLQAYQQRKTALSLPETSKAVARFNDFFVGEKVSAQFAQLILEELNKLENEKFFTQGDNEFARKAYSILERPLNKVCGVNEIKYEKLEQGYKALLEKLISLSIDPIEVINNINKFYQQITEYYLMFAGSKPNVEQLDKLIKQLGKKYRNYSSIVPQERLNCLYNIVQALIKYKQNNPENFVGHSLIIYQFNIAIRCLSSVLINLENNKLKEMDEEKIAGQEIARQFYQNSLKIINSSQCHAMTLADYLLNLEFEVAAFILDNLQEEEISDDLARIEDAAIEIVRALQKDFNADPEGLTTINEVIVQIKSKNLFDTNDEGFLEEFRLFFARKISEINPAWFNEDEKSEKFVKDALEELLNFSFRQELLPEKHKSAADFLENLQIKIKNYIANNFIGPLDENVAALGNATIKLLQALQEDYSSSPRKFRRTIEVIDEIKAENLFNINNNELLEEFRLYIAKRMSEFDPENFFSEKSKEFVEHAWKILKTDLYQLLMPIKFKQAPYQELREQLQLLDRRIIAIDEQPLEFFKQLQNFRKAIDAYFIAIGKEAYNAEELIKLYGGLFKSVDYNFSFQHLSRVQQIALMLSEYTKVEENANQLMDKRFPIVAEYNAISILLTRLVPWLYKTKFPPKYPPEENKKDNKLSRFVQEEDKMIVGQLCDYLIQEQIACVWNKIKASLLKLNDPSGQIYRKPGKLLKQLRKLQQALKKHFQGIEREEFNGEDLKALFEAIFTYEKNNDKQFIFYFEAACNAQKIILALNEYTQLEKNTNLFDSDKPIISEYTDVYNTLNTFVTSIGNTASSDQKLPVMTENEAKEIAKEFCNELIKDHSKRIKKLEMICKYVAMWQMYPATVTPAGNKDMADMSERLKQKIIKLSNTIWTGPDKKYFVAVIDANPRLGNYLFSNYRIFQEEICKLEEKHYDFQEYSEEYKLKMAKYETLQLIKRKQPMRFFGFMQTKNNNELLKRAQNEIMNNKNLTLRDVKRVLRVIQENYEKRNHLFFKPANLLLDCFRGNNNEAETHRETRRIRQFYQIR